MERERGNITEAEEIYKKAIAADPDLAAPVRMKRALKMYLKSPTKVAKKMFTD